MDSRWIGGDRRHGEGLVPWGLQRRGEAAASAAGDEGVSQCVSDAEDGFERGSRFEVQDKIKQASR